MSLTVLVIDDDDLVRFTVKTILEGDGYDVYEADNGVTGLEMYRKNPTDLVIADILMPEQDGFRTIEQLLKEFKDAKIVAISGSGGEGVGSYLDIAKDLGAQHILPKPFSLNELLDVVKKTVGSPKAA